MINVTKATDSIEVKTLCLTVYAQPGLGKTSLAFTASRPLLLDFDNGAHRAANRGDVVRITDWSEVAGIKAADVEAYDTIIIDTAGKALDVLAQDVIKSDSRLAYGGALNQQGWGKLGVRFSAFLRLIRGFGKDVILVAHMDEQKDGDQVKERLKVPGGSKDVILTDSDVIARISIFNKERHLVFSPTETSFGKDPAQLISMPVPDMKSVDFRACMADVITAVKDKLNALSDDQLAHKVEVEWFVQALADVREPDQINALLGRAKQAGKDVGRMVVARAAELQFEYDTATKGYCWLDQMKPTDDSASLQDDAA
jgi:AAA domain